MVSIRSVSGVWTFLLAILVGLAAGALAFVLTDVFLLAMFAAPAAMLLIVALCQWV